MVDLVSEETLTAVNDIFNTPLHLAALMGDVEMCEKIGGANLALLSIINIEEQTPVFLAVLCGHKQAFLCLHHLSLSLPHETRRISYRGNYYDDTILHCAIAAERFGKSIKIRFYFY